jgi:Holliday junction resolvasome RuvABC endonuclease subunit
MVQVLLNLRGPIPAEDAADALAIALCHLHGRRLRAALERPLTSRSRP